MDDKQLLREACRRCTLAGRTVVEVFDFPSSVSRREASALAEKANRGVERECSTKTVVDRRLAFGPSVAEQAHLLEDVSGRHRPV